MFQSYQLVPTLTAKENILLPAELIGLGGDVESRARELLESVGLGNRGHHYPVQLSGGEQQRVALARAFITRPPILMADEPTGNLDSDKRPHVLDLLLALNREEGTTLVLVTHDPEIAGHADRVITMRDGLVESDRLAARDRRGAMKFLAVAARIAWRELKATPSRFLFVILAVAVGVGALSGVKGFGSAFSSMLFRNAKQLTASDLTAQVWGLPNDDQLRRLREIGNKAGALTWATETVSMAARPGTTSAADGGGEIGGSRCLSLLRAVDAGAAATARFPSVR